MPRWIAARLSSDMLKRESGMPSSWGSSHARALMPTMMLGGKAPRPPVPRSLVEPIETFFEEALTPLAHDLGGRVEACRDFLVLHAFGGIEDDLGSDDVTIR